MVIYPISSWPGYNNPRIVSFWFTQLMNNSVIKDPTFPMRHAQVTELKNTAKIADLAKDADVLITRNGETIAYLVNPEHYEALISAWNELRVKVSQTVLSSYEQQHGGLPRLDAAILCETTEPNAAAQRAEWATPEEETKVFED
jgi:PHD/YefM family antitoxin component YafN of YafNO toxin-antitoxin module